MSCPLLLESIDDAVTVRVLFQQALSVVALS